MWCRRLTGDCIFCCQSCFCKNISTDNWVVAFTFLLLLHTFTGKIYSMYNGSSNVQKCRHITLYIFQTSLYQLHCHGRLWTFTSLWTVSAALVVLPACQLQFLHTIHFLPTELVSYFFQITYIDFQWQLLSKFYLFLLFPLLRLLKNQIFYPKHKWMNFYTDIPCLLSI